MIDNRITAILACLREDIASIYVQKKLNELNKETDTQVRKSLLENLR